MKTVGVVALLALLTAAASAHEMRPSLLELRAGVAGRVDVIWKVALIKGQAPPIDVVLPARCAAVSERLVDRTPTAQTSRWTLQCDGEGVAGQAVAVVGLRAVGTDVFARYRAADGAVAEALLSADAPRWTLPAGAQAPERARFFTMGLWHIATGADHLLFVLGLMLVVGVDRRRLLTTVTAFTAGHSVTLAAATLGWVHLPSRGVEAVIALSILLLAVEVSGREGRSAGLGPPWVYAVVCGLVHGLGFAGALGAVGLPADDIVAALLFFNLGVEAGQLLFIAGVLLLLAAPLQVRHGRQVAAYGIGLPAGFWFVDRVVGIATGS